MKTILLSALLLTCVCEIPFTTRQPDEWAVYGEGKSLIGVVRRWNPCVFYPLHPSLRPYISRYDRETLDDRERLMRILSDQKYQNLQISDTMYHLFKQNEWNVRK